MPAPFIPFASVLLILLWMPVLFTLSTFMVLILTWMPGPPHRAALPSPSRVVAPLNRDLAPNKVVSLRVDLAGDGQTEQVVLDPRRAQTLSVQTGRHTAWSGVPRRWKPWKLCIADVDNDGRREIIVGIRKTTRFFPTVHNCLFIYGWNGHAAYARWLGSSLSAPFTDVLFADIDGNGKNSLISVETVAGGRSRVSVYSWNGFGFTADWSKGSWKTIRLEGAGRHHIFLMADSRRLALAPPEHDH